MLSPDIIAWAITGLVRFGNMIAQFMVESAVMSYSSRTVSLFSGMTFTCHLPATSAMVRAGGGAGAGATAAVVSAAGLFSALEHATSTAAQPSNTRRRIKSSPGLEARPSGAPTAAQTYGGALPRERAPTARLDGQVRARRGGM